MITATKAGRGSAALCCAVMILLYGNVLVVRSIKMKQQKAVLHNRFNGENTPVEHLDDSLGMLMVDELIFPYAAKQYDPRDTSNLGKRYDLRERYGGT